MRFLLFLIVLAARRSRAFTPLSFPTPEYAKIVSGAQPRPSAPSYSITNWLEDVSLVKTPTASVGTGAFAVNTSAWNLLVAITTTTTSSLPTSSAAAIPSDTIATSTLLSNLDQVGNSSWGTLEQQTFPKWLNGSDGQPYESAPWGDRSTSNSDATISQDIPTTNVTRYYDFSLSRGRISADGVLRDVMLINNQFPGPLIEANWGDWIEVVTRNMISDPDEGTSLHWHGLQQRDTPWADGVPGTTQCPIAPGKSYTYRFRADLYGTSWYHAHYSAQYTAGIMGPMQIYGPSQVEYDVDIGPVMLSDWYHIPYFSVAEDAIGTNYSVIPPISDNNLINGRNSFDCSSPSYDSSSKWLASDVASNITWTCVDNAPLSKFRFQSGKLHRLRLINHGSNGVQKFSIDGHVFTIIAVDFVPVRPYLTEVITLGVGQRTDVLIVANPDPSGAYWMRANIVDGVPCGGSSHGEALAMVYNEDANTDINPVSVSSASSTDCANDPIDITEPEFAITPSMPTFQQDLDLNLGINATGHYEFLINGQTFRTNYNWPVLYLAAEGNTSYPYDPQWNVYNFDHNSSVILNVTNNFPLAHPFHLHGYNFYVLNEGLGVWDGTIVHSANPMRRDTQIIQVGGFMALQFEANNPGVWPFHCHIAWHLGVGQAMQIIVKPDEIPPIPDGEYDKTCKDWWAYTDGVIVDQIDSGQ